MPVVYGAMPVRSGSELSPMKRMRMTYPWVMRGRCGNSGAWASVAARVGRAPSNCTATVGGEERGRRQTPPDLGAGRRAVMAEDDPTARPGGAGWKDGAGGSTPVRPRSHRSRRPRSRTARPAQDPSRREAAVIQLLAYPHSAPGTDPVQGTRPSTGAGGSSRGVSAILATYVVLWIVEGAFRKWVPATESIFYVLRDAFAIASIVWLASTRSARRRLPWWIVAAFALLCLWFGIQAFMPNTPSPVVLLFGLRSYVAPFLFGVLCYRYGDPRSLDWFTTVIAVAVPVELAFAVVQVSSAPTAPVNVQVGGEPNAFTNGGEIVRTTGTFSAPLGFTVFLLVALVIALWWTERPGRRALAWGLVVCVLGTVALSGARGAVLNTAIIVIVYLLFCLTRGDAASAVRALGLCVLLVVALLVVQATLPQVLQSFLERFNNASESEDSSSRLSDWFADYLVHVPSPFGDGMGSRSNAGIALGSTAGWIENDSLRWLAELGILGYVGSLLRSAAALALALVTVVRLGRESVSVTLLRIGLVVLLATGSINETPMNEGAFGILLGALVISSATGHFDPAVRGRDRAAVGA